MLGDVVRLDVALFARAMAGKAPEIGAVVDVEHDLAAMLALAMRIALRWAASVLGLAKCVPVTSTAPAEATKSSSMSASHERRVGAIVAVEDQREGLVVLDREQHQRGQPLRVGGDAVERHAFARHLLADEAAHLLVADAGDEPRFEAEPRRADGDVGRAAAHRLGEGGDVLEPRADLLAVEIDRAAADGDDVEAGLREP